MTKVSYKIVSRQLPRILIRSCCFPPCLTIPISTCS
ncbi:Uncharacterised protein [Vibrio cholerae]|nr:Uncharacterised protein [Vibrio cholerae]